MRNQSSMGSHSSPGSQNLMTKAYLGALTLCYTNKKGRYKIIQIVRAL